LGVRGFSDESGIPRSTLQGWRYSRIKIAAETEEVDFFESEKGQVFLHRLMCCMIFCLHECGSASIGSIAEFLELSGLSAFTASKPSYLKNFARKMQTEIASFGEEKNWIRSQKKELKRPLK